MKQQIIETWYINNRVNLMLIDAINTEGMNCTLSKRGGRNVVLQFVHIHYKTECTDLKNMPKIY